MLIHTINDIAALALRSLRQTSFPLNVDLSIKMTSRLVHNSHGDKKWLLMN